MAEYATSTAKGEDHKPMMTMVTGRFEEALMLAR
jgi:hypothetical protein